MSQYEFPFSLFNIKTVAQSHMQVQKIFCVLGYSWSTEAVMELGFWQITLENKPN